MEDSENPTPLRALAYGPIVGEHSHDTMFGPFGNPLGPEDVAVSPNRLKEFPLGSMVDAVDASGNPIGTYRVSDTSFYHPGQPTKDTVEFRDRDLSNQKVFLSPSTPSLAQAMSVPINAAPLSEAAINTLPTTSAVMKGPLQYAQMLNDNEESGAGETDVLAQDDETPEDAGTTPSVGSPTPQTSDALTAPQYHKGLSVVDKAPDGSWIKWSNGAVVNRLDRSITYMSPDGTKWLQRDGEKPIKLTPPKTPPRDRISFQQLTDDTTGAPYSAKVNLDTNEITPLGNPTTRAKTQAENLKLRIINSAKQQPAIVGYTNVKNNYDSLVQNAAIPADQRTAADDAAAIQAFGAIEHPGTGVTDADKKQAAALVPLWTRIKMNITNLRDKKALVLDSDTVKTMAAAAKRALDGRQKTYESQIAPLLKQAKEAGLNPEDVVGSLFETSPGISNQNIPNIHTGTIPVPPNIKVGEEVYGNSTATGPKAYYTGANPLDKNDPANWSKTPPNQ